MPLAAFLVQPHPGRFAAFEIVVHQQRRHGADPGEAVGITPIKPGSLNPLSR